MTKQIDSLTVAPLDSLALTQQWERQSGEGEAEWAAFKEYRDQTPPRNMNRLRGRATADICRWLQDWRWIERVAALDRHMDQILMAARVREVESAGIDLAAKHVTFLTTAMDLVQKEIDKYMRLSEGEWQDAPGPMKPGDLIKLAELVSKFYRLHTGMSTENVAMRSGGQDLSKLSPDELMEMHSLLEKLSP